MSFNQTREILDHARNFHKKLLNHYSILKERATTPQTRELLDSLIEHESELEKRLLAFEEEVSDNILDTFFKYMTEVNEEDFATHELPEEVDTTYVVNAARIFDERLTDFYQTMARSSMSEQVREVLLNLMEMELHEQMILSKKALELATQ